MNEPSTSSFGGGGAGANCLGLFENVGNGNQPTPIKYRKPRIKKIRKGRILKEIELVDRSTQTSEIECENASEDHVPTEAVELKECPICMLDFDSSRPLTLLPCAHVLCLACDTSIRKQRTFLGFFPCPFCRTRVKETAPPMILKFMSARTFTKSERTSYRSTLEYLRDKHLRNVLNKVLSIEKLGKKWKSFHEMPVYCSTRSLEKKRTEMHYNLATDTIGEYIGHIKAMLVIADKFLFNLINNLTSPPPHLTFSASHYVATTMVKVMRDQKLGPFKTLK